MIKFFKYIIVVFFTIGLSHYVRSQFSTDKVFIDQFEEIVRSGMKEGDIPGLSIVVLNGEKEFVKSFGFANLEEGKPVKTNTLFELGSCSKAFTALAVTKLTDENKLNLDDMVSDYLPWFKVYYEQENVDITLRQLLNHTSGIPWHTISKIPQSNLPNALEETVRTLSDLEIKRLPGKKYEYATINYDVLALIIQTVTKIPFESYIQTNIFDELNLEHTSVGQPKDSSLMATGYKIGFLKPNVYDAPIFKGNNAAGYVISNALDIASWLKFQMGLGHSKMYELAKITHKRDETVSLHGMSSYAKGWEVSLNGSGEIYHSGMNPNFASYIIFRPKSKLGVAVLANSNSNYTVTIGNKIMKLIANEKIEKEYDPGDQNDKTYTIIVIILCFYILFLVAFFVWIAKDILKKKRKFESFNWEKNLRFIKTVLAIAPFLIGFYILPKAIANFSWESIIIWSPGSFKFLMYMIIVSIGLTYLIYFISLCFPESDKYRRIAPQILLFSLLSGFANVIIIIMVTSAIDAKEGLNYLVFYYILTLGVYLLGRRFVQINLIKFTRGLVYDLRVKIVDKIFSTSYQSFEKINRGRVYTSLNDDVNVIGQSTNTFVKLTTSIITAIGAFIYLASIATWATVLTIIIIISLTSVYYFVSTNTQIFFNQARDSRDIFMQLINGLIDGFKELSLHKNKKLEYREDVAMSAQIYKDKISIAEIRFVNAFLVGESLLVILLGVVAFGMTRLFPNIQFYTVMSFVVILLYLIGPINSILGSISELMQLKVAWNRIHNFLKDIPANLKLEKTTEKKPVKLESLTLDGLKFQYDNVQGEKVFEIGPINLNVQSGEILFIIGGNGSGKTTLAKLLTGLYKPTEGKLLINNRLIPSAEISEYFSAIFSPSYLFEKLYNTDTEGMKDEINKYLEVLKLREKVYVDNNRYSTIDLSSGQKKRLSLLQCYLEDSPIYLFDEWAADQDPEYRNFFYRYLLPEMKKQGKIVIAITHDDHYFDAADKVFKMNRGKLETFSNNGMWKSSQKQFNLNV